MDPLQKKLKMRPESYSPSVVGEQVSNTRTLVDFSWVTFIDKNYFF